MSKTQPKALKAIKKQTKKERLAEEKRLRDLVKEGIYPILLNHSKSIKDAKNIVHTLIVGMDALFMQNIKEYQRYTSEGKLEVLKLNEHMNDQETYPAEWALAELLNDETVSCAKTLMEGMEAELNRLTDKELSERSLTTLPTEWL